MRPPRIVRRAFARLPAPVRSEVLHHFGYYAPWEEGFDFSPPALRDGEVAGPPDFVGVGVQKAGTSWWYSLILDHPDVTDREDVPKERHYLSRFLTDPFGPEEVRRYHGWFPREAGTQTGEWTPDYFCCPWVAPLLVQAAPEAKVLVLLRDPVERFLSGLTFRLRMGAPDTSATVADAVRQGFYARSLVQLYEHVPPARVLVLQYEQCRSDPEGQLAATYRFLGLDDYVPHDVRREVNVSGGRKLTLDGEARRRLVDLYVDDVERLAGLVGSVDLALWPNFAHVSA